jgi:hypothetical protein
MDYLTDGLHHSFSPSFVSANKLDYEVHNRTVVYLIDQLTCDICGFLWHIIQPCDR